MNPQNTPVTQKPQPASPSPTPIPQPVPSPQPSVSNPLPESSTLQITHAPRPRSEAPSAPPVAQAPQNNPAPASSLNSSPSPSSTLTPQPVSPPQPNTTNSVNASTATKSSSATAPTAQSDTKLAPSSSKIPAPIKKIQKASATIFPIILKFFKAPVATLKQYSQRFESPKDVIVLTISVVATLAIFHILRFVLLNTHVPVMTKQFGFGYGVTKIDQLPLPSFALHSLIFYITVITLSALVYYFIATIIKKRSSYMRFLALVSVSFIPYALFSLLPSALFSSSLVAFPALGQILQLFGAIATMLIFMITADVALELASDDNRRFHLYLLMLVLFCAVFTIAKTIFFDFTYVDYLTALPLILA